MKQVSLTHKQQQKIWDEEHKNPYVLHQMDSGKASSGVIKFVQWLKRKKSLSGLSGIELGCGKGRNVIELAKLGVAMTGIDFSPTAIKEAKRRATELRIDTSTHFVLHDATKPWPFDSNSFDIAIDCFATTDIETPSRRLFVGKQMARVLKPGGYLLAYLLSPQDEFHKYMLQKHPAAEKNAFIHPTSGKFEKTFDREEVVQLYSDLTLIEEARVEKKTIFFGKEYNCYHHWMVFTKSNTNVSS